MSDKKLLTRSLILMLLIQKSNFSAFSPRMWQKWLTVIILTDSCILLPSQLCGNSDFLLRTSPRPFCLLGVSLAFTPHWSNAVRLRHWRLMDNSKDLHRVLLHVGYFVDWEASWGYAVPCYFICLPVDTTSVVDQQSSRFGFDDSTLFHCHALLTVTIFGNSQKPTFFEV